MTGHILIASFMGLGLLLFGLIATAQSPRYRNYDRGECESVQTLLHHVRSDLDRAERNAYADYEDDQRRFERVRGELSELQHQWDGNEYSPSQIDNLIIALQTVLSDNDLALRDHDVLAGNLNQLRDFRARHGY